MGKDVYKQVYRAFIALVMGVQVLAQTETPPLERIISIELESESTREALRKIETAGGFSFAYQTSLINQSNQLTRSYSSKTTREILDDLFQGELVYREKGNYVLLKTSPVLKEQEVKLEGYVYNRITNEKIAYASLFDTVTLASAVSDPYGHYVLRMHAKESIRLTVKKAGFRDTSFVWNGQGNAVLNVGIAPLVVAKDSIPPVEPENKFRGLKLSEEQLANIANFRESIRQKFQFSLVPGVGTNGRLSSVTKVDYSVNLLGGLNGGVRKAEVGALFNMVWDSVQYFQAAGVFNTVGGEQRGVQLAGVTNLNNASFNGVQAGGVYNLTRVNFKGAQLAGFMNNTLGSVNGVQAAGFWNHMGDSSVAGQFAGFGNFAKYANTGVQAAGFINIAQQGFNGAQIAGFYNLAGQDARGLQAAGFLNTVGDCYSGVQVAGFLNIAQRMKGVQLGVININDSIEGVPIGVFSYSRQGYHQLEVNTNEVFPLNLAFKTGTHQFYNIFTAGVRFAGSNPYWTYGYGAGTSVRIAKRSRLFLDVQQSQIQQADTPIEVNLLSKAVLSYHVNVTDWLGISIGPSFNVLTRNTSTDNHLADVRIAPYDFYDKIHHNHRVQMWVGGQLALKFF